MGYDMVVEGAPEDESNTYLRRNIWGRGPTVEAVERALADHGAGDVKYIGGIPAHKFSSNDGWHVTDKECVEALNAYEVSIQAGDAHPEALRDDVIPFLRPAAKYEGFRVF